MRRERHILHILKDADSATAVALIDEQARLGLGTLHVLLIQDAVGFQPVFTGPVTLKVSVLKEDLAERRARAEFETVDYRAMLGLIFDSDSVVAW